MNKRAAKAELKREAMAAAAYFNGQIAGNRNINRSTFTLESLTTAQIERKELKKVTCGFITSSSLPEPYVMAMDDSKYTNYRPFPDVRRPIRKLIPF